jgi:acyl carrier protein
MRRSAVGVILASVIDHLRHSLDLGDVELTGATNPCDDLGLDSLDLVTAFLDLEDDFQIEMPADAPARFVTLIDVARYIATRVPWFDDAPVREFALVA